MNEKNKYDEAARKQIEEMAKELCGINIACKDCRLDKLCLARNSADILYTVGYRKQSDWISVEERLPEVETKVLVLAIRKYKTKEGLEIPVITTGMYEDGTMPRDDSCWYWEDIDFIYDEKNDIAYIPEGWWEYSSYHDECGAICDKVTHWMPLPEAPKMKGGAE